MNGVSLRPTKSPQSPPAGGGGDGGNQRVRLEDILGINGREHIDVVVPRTNVKGRMRLCSHREVAELTSEARKYLVELGLPDNPTQLAAMGFINRWHDEIAVRHLQIAVRDPKDESKPLAAMFAWRECDGDQISALFIEYQDLADRIDPLGASSRLTDQEKIDIERALGKRDATVLQSYGSRRLSLYLLSTASPPES